MPESFKVLIKELRSLCLDVQIFNAQGKEVDVKEEIDSKDEINENLMKEIT
jgi:DNA-directed RNA polymerase subunit beta